MADHFHPMPCKNLDHFLMKIKPLLSSNDKWVFRGQRNTKWSLETTLERACKRFGVKVTEIEKIERQMIREFQRRLHHYTVHVPCRDELDEWMALMRHHGAPTRILDVTYSPFVAAYFAFEKADPKSRIAVWAVNTNWCERELESRSKDLAKHYLEYQEYRKQEAFNAIFVDPSDLKLFVLSVTPYRLNERLAYQRGAFLCPRDVTVGFMDNLSSFTGSDHLEEKVIKFTIPAGNKGKIRDNALEQLDQMNINRITLFPGLDGFAQSFEARIPFFLKQRWDTCSSS